jgi:nucleotidyltransferase/DNA polymerase involved in DNA repair
MKRVILHVDMDAFFAAVEQRENPDLKGKPVIIGADPKGGSGRGVVSTCSYEARKYGVHSAMPISEAYKRCPNGIYIPPNGSLYSQVSRSIFEIYYEFTDRVEPISIDEAFLDVTGSIRLMGSGVTIARLIKDRIVEKEKITASVGIAPNKYLAKIASDLEKPDGLVVVEEDHIEEFLHPLDISRLWGAGIKTQQRLRKMGVKTIGDLARFPLNILEKTFGKTGVHFYHLAHGIDNREVRKTSGVKSISNEHTFEKDEDKAELLLGILLKLSEKVGYRLRKKKLRGKTIHLKLRYDDFSTITRNHTLMRNFNSTATIYNTVKKLFEENYNREKKIRLLGVGVSNFDVLTSAQSSIFDEEESKKQKLDLLQDVLNDRFGRNIISRAETMNLKTNRDNNDFDL